MCPDPQMISLYFDGELPSPWKEKMDAHLRECPACEKSLSRYRELSRVLRDGPPESKVTEAGAFLAELPAPALTGNTPAVLSAARNEASCPQERVWLRLNTQGGPDREMIPLHTWNRTIPVPLPMIAAAAAALIMAFGFFFIRSSVTASDQAVAAVDVTTIVPISDLSGVLQFLGDESPDIVIIRLPESKSFMSSGRPAIIKAADYSGNKEPR